MLMRIAFCLCVISSLDLVISCLGLHWTNDLPGAMIQVCVMTFYFLGNVFSTFFVLYLKENYCFFFIDCDG